ncbi:hypothetical protein L210DRAFT_2766467 [Boletus edulis BED1]|uniref:Uncharacterized protein n=1 Tax=Boletus edulis BED1 TaxID=1328754 RepID=A0AAD4GAU1_BOLED|nr:hypothetical protein L210DRAFT_2766467 [Boletus edulis BED1]
MSHTVASRRPAKTIKLRVGNSEIAIPVIIELFITFTALPTSFPSTDHFWTIPWSLALRKCFPSLRKVSERTPLLPLITVAPVLPEHMIPVLRRRRGYKVKGDGVPVSFSAATCVLLLIPSCAITSGFWSLYPASVDKKCRSRFTLRSFIEKALKLGSKKT